jgi:hypothetical protein
VFRATGSGLTRLYTGNGADSVAPQLRAVQWVGDNIVTVSTAPDGPQSGPTVDYSVRVWRCLAEQDRDLEPPRSVQSLTLRLPRSSLGQSSSALLNPHLECALSAEPGRQRYLLLSSRRSNLVACLAVNPGSAGQPLYHVTCLDLRAPVVSVGVTTVLGQAHHSAEAGEHLEVSCYQEAAAGDPAQASIQQYHVLFAQVFDYQTYSAGLPQPPKTDIAAAAAAPAEPSVAASTKGMTILNMLNNFSRPGSSPATPSTPAGPTAAPNGAAPAALSTPGIVRPGSSSGQSPVTPSAAGTPSGAPAAAAFSGKAALDALLSGKKGSGASSQPPVSPAPAQASTAGASTQGLPDFLLRAPSPANASILNVLKAASSSKAGTASTSQAPGTPATPQSSQSAQPQQPPTLTPPPAAAAVPPSPLQALSARKAAQTASQPPAVAAGGAGPSSATLPAPAPVSYPSTQGPAADSDSVARLLRDLQVSFASAQTAQQKQAFEALQLHQQQANKQLQQSAKELQAAQNKHNEALLAAMKKAVEAETKKAQDSSSASAGTMRVEVGLPYMSSYCSCYCTNTQLHTLLQMSEQIMRELVPSITAKVRDSVRDTVRDAVKGQLPAAFRDSFESALLPAFEAGAQAMFQQLQTAFAQGLQGVMQEGLRAQQGAAAHTARLEQEVRDLRDSVGRLEGTVASLAELLRGGGAGGGLSPRTEAEAEPDDAFALLKKVSYTYRGVFSIGAV